MATGGGTETAGEAAEAPRQEPAAQTPSSSAGWGWQPWQWQQGNTASAGKGPVMAAGLGVGLRDGVATLGETPLGKVIRMLSRSLDISNHGPEVRQGTLEAVAKMRHMAATPARQRLGKDFIPEYDGSGPMREYQRRVKLFEMSTGIDPSYRAQKLMEKLTGNAWLATESIPLESLKHPDGVSRLLDHLWKELEPLEFLRTFQTLADFYKGFRRPKGQEFVAYDMEFRRHGQRLEEIEAGLSGVTRAYWFLVNQHTTLGPKIVLRWM